SAAVLPLFGAATSNGGGRVGVFGRRDAANVTFAEFNGSTWGPTVDLGGSVNSGLSAVNDPAGLYVFARGTRNNHICYQRNTGSGWAGGWTSITGNVVSDPAAVSHSSGL